MLLEVANLAIDLAAPAGAERVVDRGTFALGEGESLGVVGELGSGKTMTALALMGLAPENARVSGSIRFEGRELVGLKEEAMLALRGDRIAMIFQEPMTALNPLHRVGDQVAEPLVLHRGMARAAAFERAIELLGHVRLAEPRRAAQGLSFRALGRRAPAGDDRDGDRLLAPSRHRRRADDRARCDRSGAHSRIDRRAAGGIGNGAPSCQP